LVLKIHTLKNNQSGQVMIEFILVLVFALGITFIFVHMSMNYTIGYLNHYATFMSSRTFLTVDSGSNNAAGSWATARNQAIKTFQKYQLSQFGVPNINQSNVKMHVDVGGEQNSMLFVGVTSLFEKKLSSFQAVGGSEKAKFLSESFLGKEPVRVTCLEQVCRAMGLSDCSSKAQTLDVVLYDNGC
jgi:uncharacterized protein (UPF0333 family)